LTSTGLYGDDGLVISNSPPRVHREHKKDICQIFSSNGLRTTIEASKQVISFLDILLKLNKGTFLPYTKPEMILQYIHCESNHQLGTAKRIITGINKRLSSLSSDKASFNQAMPQCQKELIESGYKYTLHYELTLTAARKNRKQNSILWYNPPHSVKLSAPTSDANFKISYSCMNNIKQTTDSHNKRIIKSHDTNNTPTDTKADVTCNCRQKSTCPLNWSCLQSSIIYQVTVIGKDNNATQIYIGLTGKTSLRHDIEITPHLSATINTVTQQNSANTSRH